MKQVIEIPNIGESVKDGYIEAVVFAFYKEGRVLIERRPESIQNNVFIPSGRIEDKDKQGDEGYKITALKREVSEELNVKVLQSEYLMDIKQDEKKLWFYVYVITEWDGELPTYTVEPPGSGQKYADLEWIDIKEYENVSDYKIAHQISEAIIKRFGLK